MAWYRCTDDSCVVVITPPTPTPPSGPSLPETGATVGLNNMLAGSGMIALATLGVYVKKK